MKEGADDGQERSVAFIVSCAFNYPIKTCKSSCANFILVGRLWELFGFTGPQEGQGEEFPSGDIDIVIKKQVATGFCVMGIDLPG